jgi:hypothetical protein
MNASPAFSAARFDMPAYENPHGFHHFAGTVIVVSPRARQGQTRCGRTSDQEFCT